MSNRLFIIDAHGLCYRAFYAVKSLKNSKGQPTNAVFGFCNILRKLLADCKPTHIAVCFDMGGKTHRQERYPNYKIHRQAMPDDLITQIQTIRSIIKAFNFPIFEMQGYEADDVMATLSERFANDKVDVFIATEDKDMAQLVDGQIKLYSPKQEKIIDSAAVIAKFGVEPSQITDYIALAGDASDNIPGVKGIGEVGAKKLIAQYKSLEGIYAGLVKLQEKSSFDKYKPLLIQYQQEALLSKELATVDRHVALKASLENLIFPEPNRVALYEIFKDLEFRNLAQEYAPINEIVHEETPDLKSYVKTTVDGRDLIIAYDLKSLRKNSDIQLHSLNNDIFDVYLADYLLSGGQGQYQMSKLRETEAGMKELYLIQSRLLKNEGLEFLFHDVEMPLSDVLFKMEKQGVKLDVNVLKVLSQECTVKMAQLEESLFATAGVSFNINSPKQLSEILFERLKLPKAKKIKTGYSTNEEVLTKLAEQHPLPAMILEYRQLSKLKSTYIDALPLLVDAHARLHATFDQAGALTGRLSARDPNLQNIPIRTEFGQRIRKAFVSYAEDHVLLSADYSQIELRILALLANDDALKNACRGKGDIHRHTASLMFDVPEDHVDDKMRYAAKRINFGIIYGMSAFGLAHDLDVTIAQAKDFIDKYFLRYPQVRKFLDGEMQKARDTGFVKTYFGRRRYLPDIHSRNIGLRQFAERQAINAPMQGTAADIIKIAMVKIDQELQLKKLSTTMLMTVHDELVFDVPLGELKDVAVLVRATMQGVIECDVPMQVSMKIGPNWLEMKNIDADFN